MPRRFARKSLGIPEKVEKMNAETPARSVRKLIGMLTPSSNTVLEPFTAHMLEPLFPDVSTHFARFRVTQIGLDAKANSQFALPPIVAAAELLADARCDVIAWNGTSASWLGFDSDERLCAAITERTGIAATSAILSLNRLLERLSVRRLGLVTPYTRDVQEKIAANYASIGIEVVSEAHGGLSDNFSFAEVGEEEIERMCRDVAAKGRPEAIAIVCTNMRGPLVAARLEARLGIPVLDSVAFTLWGCLDGLAVDMNPLGGFGSIFLDPADTTQPKQARG
jgi:maleate isomerase